ncbi:MAG: RodZ domain-containing protein [Nostocaceae cyanobacterium]|nr:RodZ domain-containing protein [Nostocaceae cyanobacterium]
MMKWRSKKNKRDDSHPLEQQRAEKLAELGSQLRSTREQLGFNLEEVAAYTKIQRRLLQAIEEGKLEELPEPIYTQSFIRQYAHALGYNGAEFASAFPTAPSRVNIKPVWRNIPGAQLRPVHLYLVYIVLIFCSVNGLSQMLTRSEVANSNSSRQESNNPPDAKPNSTLSHQQQPVRPVSTSKPNPSQPVQPVRIGLVVKDKSWVRVVADGKTAFEGVLPQGAERTWEAHEQLTVRAGNAGGVLMTVNNQPEPKQMGNPGEVQEVTIAANPQS